MPKILIVEPPFSSYPAIPTAASRLGLTACERYLTAYPSGEEDVHIIADADLILAFHDGPSAEIAIICGGYEGSDLFRRRANHVSPLVDSDPVALQRYLVRSGGAEIALLLCEPKTQLRRGGALHVTPPSIALLDELLEPIVTVDRLDDVWGSVLAAALEILPVVVPRRR